MHFMTLAVNRLSSEGNSYNPTQAAFYDTSGLELYSSEKKLAEGIADEKVVRWGAIMQAVNQGRPDQFVPRTEPDCLIRALAGAIFSVTCTPRASVT